MNRTLTGAVAVAAFGVAIPVVGIASPASASCTSPTPRYTSATWLASEPFNASIDCNGVWANGVQSHSDYVRGWFYINSTWTASTYGWQWVTNSNGARKIIGNTVNGRRCMGDAYQYSQDVYYNY